MDRTTHNISNEVFNKEIMLCRKLSADNGGKCGWGECDRCGVIGLLHKLHKGVLLEGEELRKIKDEALN